MKRFCGLIGLILAVTPALAQDPITVFVAKRIITIDPGQPDAQAVAVRGERIVAVGTLKSLGPWLNAHPHTIDRRFANKVILPGLIDPHQHVILAAVVASLPKLSYFEMPNLDGSISPVVRSKQAALDRLTAYVTAAKARREPSLLAWGYDPVALGSHLTRADIDLITADYPVMVWDSSLHNAYANSAMLTSLGLTAATAKAVPDGILLDSAGELSGVFLGNNAAAFVLRPALARLLSPAALAPILSGGAELYHRGGVTTIGELGYGSVSVALETAILPRFYNDERTPVRAVAVAFEPVVGPAFKDKAVETVLGWQAGGTSRFRVNGVKLMSDDAFLTLGMRAGEPGYVDGHQGLWLTPPDQMYARIKPWWDAGFAVHVHSNGRESQDVVIAALRRLQAEKPRFDHRFTFEHLGMANSTQIAAIAALGAQASVNPWYIWQRGEFNEAQLGEDRAHLASRLATLAAAGVRTALHTDTPVAPPTPLVSAWIAVNRLGQSGKTLAPNERVSVATALRMITIDAAYMIGMESEVGSIEAGKLADFTVVEADPLTTPPLKLKDIVIWGTVLGGKLQPIR